MKVTDDLLSISVTKGSLAFHNVVLKNINSIGKKNSVIFTLVLYLLPNKSFNSILRRENIPGK